MDPWGSLANQPSLLGKFQASKRLCLKSKNKNKVDGTQGTALEADPGILYAQVHILLHVCMHIQCMLPENSWVSLWTLLWDRAPCS